MNIYCIESFKNAFEKLIGKKPYKSLESEIIAYFFDKAISELISGTRLNNSLTEPFIKKRIEGSGGFRIYFLIIIKNGDLYFMFVHPKTGSDGADNIDDEYKARLYKNVLNCIKTKNLYLLKLNNEKDKIVFSSM